MTLAALFICFISSCTGDETADVSRTAEKSLYISSTALEESKHLNSEVITRLTGDDVPVLITKGSIGIFRSQGIGYTNELNNKKYTYMGAENGWQPATSTDTIFLSAANAEVCAYYPYNPNTEYDKPTALPVNSGKYTGTAEQYDPNDLCYDVNRTMSAFKRSTAFNLKHALAMLEFKISKEANYGGECRITSVMVMNPNLIKSSSINIATGTYGPSTKGTITYNPGTNEEGALVGSNAFTTAALLVPSTPTSSGLAISLTINGRPIETNIPISKIAELEAGHRYTVKITLKATAMQVTGVDVFPWIETAVGGEETVWYPKPIGIQLTASEINLGGSTCTASNKDVLSKLIWAEGNLKSTGISPIGNYVWGSPTEYGYYYTWMSLYTGNTTIQGNQDPCLQLEPTIYGAGWRTPSKIEFESLIKCTDKVPVMNNGTRGIWFMNKTKGLFLPTAGFRDSDVGSGISPTTQNGVYGFYWSSNADSQGRFYMGLGSNDTHVLGDSNKTFGLSVRCVKTKK